MLIRIEGREGNGVRTERFRKRTIASTRERGQLARTVHITACRTQDGSKGLAWDVITHLKQERTPGYLNLRSFDLAFSKQRN
jgi:hypothetical protein